MMRNPDKYIRKYFYDKLNGINVNGNIIHVYDVNAPVNEKLLIILSTQSGSDDWETKCSIDKNRQITLDVITRYEGTAGSRALLDDIVEKVIDLTQKITIENFTVQYHNVSYPSDMTMNAGTETIHRKLINYSIKIK
jgi:hypothetical protein